jgi:hypothetical protein
MTGERQVTGDIDAMWLLALFGCESLILRSHIFMR